MAHFHNFKIKRDVSLTVCGSVPQLLFPVDKRDPSAAVVAFLRPAPRSSIFQLDFWIPEARMPHVKSINAQPTILTAHVTKEHSDSLCKMHDYADQ